MIENIATICRFVLDIANRSRWSLPSCAAVVLAVLANPGKRMTFKRLAREARIGTRTSYRAVKALEKAGVLVREDNRHRGALWFVVGAKQ